MHVAPICGMQAGRLPVSSGEAKDLLLFPWLVEGPSTVQPNSDIGDLMITGAMLGVDLVIYLVMY